MAVCLSLALAYLFLVDKELILPKPGKKKAPGYKLQLISTTVRLIIPKCIIWSDKHQSPNKTTVEYVDDATSSQATQAVEYVPPDGGQIKTEPIRPTDAHSVWELGVLSSDADILTCVAGYRLPFISVLVQASMTRCITVATDREAVDREIAALCANCVTGCFCA